MAVGTPGAIQQPSVTSGVFGQGVSYPLSYNKQGRLNLSSGTTCVEEALRAILETSAGERAMLPDYGSRLGEFEPVDMGRLIAKFKKDVADYEPRVDEIVNIDPIYGPGSGQVTITITYTLVGDANERILTAGLFQGP